MNIEDYKLSFRCGGRYAYDIFSLKKILGGIKVHPNNAWRKTIVSIQWHGQFKYTSFTEYKEDIDFLKLKITAPFSDMDPRVSRVLTNMFNIYQVNEVYNGEHKQYQHLFFLNEVAE